MTTEALTAAELGLMFSAIAGRHGEAFAMEEGFVAFSDANRTYTIELHANQLCLLFNAAVASNLSSLTSDQLSAILSMNVHPDLCAHGWLAIDADQHEILLVNRCQTLGLTEDRLWREIEAFVGFSGSIAAEIAQVLAVRHEDTVEGLSAPQAWVRA